MGGAEGSRDRIGVGWRGQEKEEDRNKGRVFGDGKVEGRGYVPYLIYQYQVEGSEREKRKGRNVASSFSSSLLLRQLYTDC